MSGFGMLRCRPMIRLSKLALNTNTLSRRLSSLSMLASLPEFKAAIDFDKRGNFAQAVPLYQRTHEVLSSSTGVSSELSVHVALQLAKLYIHSSQYNLAEKMLSNEPFIDRNQTAGKDMGKDNIMNIIKGQQLRASMLLLKGDPAKASEAAEVASNLCEAQTDIDITVHGASYGLKGLSYLFSGEMNDAEQYLQMAARWSQSPKENAVALNNLGTLSWIKLGQSMAEKEGNKEGNKERRKEGDKKGDIDEYHRFLNRDLLYFSHEAQSRSPILTAEQVLLLNEALNYWEEAIEESTSDRDGGGNAQQVAAAMCGVNIPLGDISMPTPLTVPESPIGMEVRKIPNVLKNQEKEKKSLGGNDVLSVRLKDVHFAMNYTSILCNVAVGRSLQAAQKHKQKPIEKKETKDAKDSSKSDSKGADKVEKEGDNGGVKINKSTDNKSSSSPSEAPSVTSKQYEEQMSEEIKTSVEILSSAIKALEAHTASIIAGSGGGGEGTGAGGEVDSKVATTEQMIAPVLGRALGQLGLLYLHPFRGTHPEPVFAEGLFRAALDKLNGPYAVKDKRYLYERAVITRDYGQLLTKWDKREESGENMKRDAGMIFEMLPTQGDLVFNSMILLPTDIYIES